MQHRSSERLSRREGLTIKAAAAAEGQGFASDAGIKCRDLCCWLMYMHPAPVKAYASYRDFGLYTRTVTQRLTFLHDFTSIS